METMTALRARPGRSGTPGGGARAAPGAPLVATDFVVTQKCWELGSVWGSQTAIGPQQHARPRRGSKETNGTSADPLLKVLRLSLPVILDRQ
jgi:hypothetical protein